MCRSMERCRRQTVALLLAAAAVLGASAPVADAAPSPLTKLAKAHPNRRVEVIVQFKARTPLRTTRAIVRSHHGKVVRRLPAVNGLFAKLRARHAVALRRHRRVRNVTLNTRMRSTTPRAALL